MICDNKDHQILHEIILIVNKGGSNNGKYLQIEELLGRYFLNADKRVNNSGWGRSYGKENPVADKDAQEKGK